MLPKVNRLPSSQIPQVMRFGRRLRMGSNTIIFNKSSMTLSRFAFIVPVSVDKHAVVRNTLKRRLRDLVHKNLFNIKSGWDVVISINKNRVTTNLLQHLDQDVMDLFSRSSMLNTKND